MNNYNIISPFQLTVESDSKKNAIKKLINKKYINDKNIEEYSNQVILEDEYKNKFNAQALFYRKYHSHSNYVPKVRINFIPTTANSVYGLPVFRSPMPMPVHYPVRIARPISPISYPFIARTPIISARPISPIISARPISPIISARPISPIISARPISPLLYPFSSVATIIRPVPVPAAAAPAPAAAAAAPAAAPAASAASAAPAASAASAAASAASAAAPAAVPLPAPRPAAPASAAAPAASAAAPAAVPLPVPLPAPRPAAAPAISTKLPIPVIRTLTPPPLGNPNTLSPVTRLPSPTIPISPVGNSELFTSGDILGLTQIDNTAENPIYLLNIPHFETNIEPKLVQRKRKLTINNNINTDRYTDIYFTSDLHSDYRKLVQILVNARLISIPSGINIYSNDIYDPRIITESNWLKPNSLFIIIGDLVDGTRPNISSVDDNQGSFELLLHLLLYNLKIKAEQNNSDVIFTLGNHDLHSVIMNTNVTNEPKFCFTGFIHTEALTFFQDESIRGLKLSKFYELSPYLFLNLNNNEIVTVHGGLHNPYGTQLLNIDTLIEIQNNINRNGLSEINYEKFNNNRIEDVSSNRNIQIGALWTRFYAESTDRALVCNTIKNNNKQYKFIVVGHCPTNNFRTLTNIMNADKTSYNSCDRDKFDNGKGCVVVDTCRDVNNAPVLAFVDAALSQAFRTGPHQVNENRDIELLHLHHDPSIKQLPGRKYNVISRLEVANKRDPIDIRMY